MIASTDTIKTFDKRQNPFIRKHLCKLGTGRRHLPTPTASVMPNGKHRTLSLWDQDKRRCPVSLLLLHIVPEVLSSEIRRETYIKI